MIEKEIDELETDNVVVEINSGGGSVFAGSEIYTAIKKLNATVEIVGLAGSAASFIAMAGQTVKISPTAQIMIHNASTFAIGDKHDMTDTSDFLNSIDSSIAYAYQLKTGLEQTELLEMMTKETWLNAEQALDKGFADEIMFVENYDAVASTSVVLPQNVVDKVRNVLKGNKEPKNNEFAERLEGLELKMDELMGYLNLDDGKYENKKEEIKADPINKGSFNLLKKWR